MFVVVNIIFLFCNIFFIFSYYIIYFYAYIYLEGIVVSVNNVDMAKLMSILSKMDKKDLEEGLSKASQILNSKDADSIINDIKKNQGIQ